MNLELQNTFDPQKEIKDRLISEEDLYAYEFHINGLEVDDEKQVKEQCGERTSKKQLLEMLLQRQSQRNNIYFSISDQKKVRKFLYKIEQCLIKSFGLDEKSILKDILEREDKEEEFGSRPEGVEA